MNIVMIGLSKKLPKHDETYDLHRLLMTLLSDKLTVKEKLGIVKEEYEIPIEDDFRREVDVMCNLSQGIKEDAIAIGRAEGEVSKLKELIQKKLDKQKTSEQIADELEEDVEVIQKLIYAMHEE